MTTTTTVPVLSTPAPDTSGSGLGGIDTVTWDEFTSHIHQAERSGLCTHPIRLKGRTMAVDLVTGELRPMYDTATQPGGVLLTTCGNRRESICPPCSQVYKRDARQLVRAGLVGGKGVPDSIAAHPCVFATFTAPSFGPVHSRRIRGKTVLPCRPRRDANVRRCPHERDISCPTRHVEDDPRLGRAMCPDCYDYQAAVLFNAYTGKLWRRFTTYLPRHLARLAGVTGKTFRAQVRIRYVKVAEYQARGVVHFHAVIRLDAATEEYQPPAHYYTAGLLCDAIDRAVAAVRVSADIGTNCPVLLRFGTQTDRRPVRRDVIVATGMPLDADAVANYIAKYVTKTLDAPGVPDRPLRSLADILDLRCSKHYRKMITTAWELGGGKLSPARSRLCKWAHMFGYGGHPLTKSRRYSTTFGHLRRVRIEHRKRLAHPHGEQDPWGRSFDETVVLVLKDWTYQGRGHITTAGQELALASAARAREHFVDAVAWFSPSIRT
jgi:hypothetical protein